MTIRCEGYRKPGAFQLAPPVWTQCENDAIVMITIEQEGKIASFPACEKCWQDAIDRKIKIISVCPIVDGMDIE